MTAQKASGDISVPPRPPSPTPTAEAARPFSTPSRGLRAPHIAMIAYGGVLAAIAFWPVPVDRDAGSVLRLITKIVPLLTYPRIEFSANVLLFAPLGFLLILLLPARPWLAMPVSFLVSVTIECVQAVALHERTPSILDVVANTAGACLGIVLAVLTCSHLKRKRELALSPSG